MSTGWIDELMRLNTHIVASEARLAAHVDTMLTQRVQGQDTSEVLKRLTICWNGLRLLRDTSHLGCVDRAVS